MFKRRDIPPTLLLALLIILVILTLSQILVVHTGNLGTNRYLMKKLQVELRELDINLHSVMMHRVPSIELNRRLLQNQINSNRFLHILHEASQMERPKTNTVDGFQSNNGGDGSDKSDLFNSNSKPNDKHGKDKYVVTHNVMNTDHANEINNNYNMDDVISLQDINNKNKHSLTDASPVNSSWQTSQILDSENEKRQHTKPTMRTNEKRSNTMEVLEASPSSNTSHNIRLNHSSSSLLLSLKESRINGVSASLNTNLQTSLSFFHLSPIKTDTSSHSQVPILKSEPIAEKKETRQKVNTPDLMIRRIFKPVNSHQQSSHRKQSTQYCNSVPPNLKGSLAVDIHKALHIGYQDVLRINTEVKPGGVWRPSHCVARHKVAIVIPYRDRKQHLLGLLYYLHPLLQSQQLDYRIFVVEQQGNDTFNKARLMNVAFVEASKLYPFQCVIFHDVDLIPEDDRNMYSCPVQPRHTSVAIDEMDYKYFEQYVDRARVKQSEFVYPRMVAVCHINLEKILDGWLEVKLAYHELVGGVLNMRREHFQLVNGYSNLYWGWGAEDDDMAYRIMQVGLKITRPPESIARYKTIKHTKRKPSDWRKRAKLLVTGPKRYQFDGLNSLTYNLISIKDMKIYTHILVYLGKPPKSFS